MWRTLEGRGVEGAVGATAGVGAAVDRVRGQKAPFSVDKRPTSWWGRCSTTV